MDKGTILVVEDEPNIADLVDLYLSRDGFRVVKKATGRTASPRSATSSRGSSSSTSGSRTSTAWRCAGASARRARSR